MTTPNDRIVMTKIEELKKLEHTCFDIWEYVELMAKIIIEQQEKIEKLQSEVYLSNIGSIRMEND